MASDIQGGSRFDGFEELLAERERIDSFAGEAADIDALVAPPPPPQAARAVVRGSTPSLALLVAACGGGGGGDGSSAGGGTTSAAPVTPAIAKPQSDPEAARFLLRTNFAITPDDIASVRSLGYGPWLDREMDRAPANIAYDWLVSQGYNTIDANRYFDNFYPGDRVMWHQLLTSPDQLRKRVALALSEIFVISLTGLDFSWRASAMAYYWDQLAGNAFGSFRKLLEDVTLNPAMGFFLSTRGNQKEDTRTGRQPDENYAREVMQLFTIGLSQLNIDGTPKLDAQGRPLDSYTQADVTNLARVFTGYDFDATGNVRTEIEGGRRIDSPDFTRRPMTTDGTKWLYPSNTSRHSTLEKAFLGTTIPANTDAATSLRTALDTLTNHPNVGPFIGKQLIQRLVTSNPSAAYVQRVATVFNNNGSGVRGDLRAVVKAVLTDSEALASTGLTSPTFGKVREPMVRLAQWGRTFGASSTSGGWLIGDLSTMSNQIGQSPMRSPSVFNFFRPGFVPPGTAIAQSSLVAPEFQIVNETSVAGYVNFMTNTIRSGIANDVIATYANAMALVLQPQQLVDQLDLLMTGGQLTAATKTTIVNAVTSIAVTETSTDAVKRNRVNAAVLLVMASPEYLVQK